MQVGKGKGGLGVGGRGGGGRAEGGGEGGRWVQGGIEPAFTAMLVASDILPIHAQRVKVEQICSTLHLC